MRKIDPILHERLSQLIGAMGYELVGCETLPQGRQMVFRIYIDSPKGVTVDDCSLVSRQVGAMLDVDGPYQDRYVLEVSSPGIDRPLFELEQYHNCVGKRIKVRLYAAIDNRRQFKGILQRIEGEDIYLLIDDTEEEVKLSYSMIDKANLVGEAKI